MDYEKIVDKETIWGELYQPEKPKVNSGNGLRVALFVSCNCGNIVLNCLNRYEQKYPGLLNIVGVATDDPIHPDAKISVKKRIWSQYSNGERAELRQKVIDSSLNAGLSCYTGAVKTDYFRKIYKLWNPDVLVMFCFGQKLDSFLFDYPALGAYNLHPSDLPKQMGAGTQPFQNAIQNGLKTSPLVIHQITELIDMGQIVGVSPPINIKLANGQYPKSLLTLLEKITSIGGWMSTQLISYLVNKKASGESGPLGMIDFDEVLPLEIRQLLMQPAKDDLTEMYEVPLHPLLM